MSQLKSGVATALVTPAALQATGSRSFSATLTNRTDRLEWLRGQGFGLFIHWSVDSQ